MTVVNANSASSSSHPASYSPNMRMSVNKAFQFTESGPLSKTLKLVETPIPEPQRDEIVVKISAAALNPVDVQL